MDTGYNLINEWFVMSHQIRPTGALNSTLHYHHSYEIFVMISGSTTMLVNDRLIELSGGDIILLKPDDLHKNNGVTRHERYAIHFTNKYILNYYTPAAAQMLVSVFDNNKRTIKSEVFIYIVNLLRNMENNSDTAFIHIGEILAMIMNKQNHVRTKKCCHYQPTEKILEFINKNYRTIGSLDDIANAVHISKQYLCTVFKHETGVTVSEYVNSIRINNACELLRSENSTVTEIASECGYNSPMYFCKMFKKFVHMTPNEYRKYVKTARYL